MGQGTTGAEGLAGGIPGGTDRFSLMGGEASPANLSGGPSLNMGGGGGGIMEALGNLMGKTPEERQTNLKSLSGMLDGYSKIAGSTKDSTLMENLQGMFGQQQQFGGRQGPATPVQIPQDFTPEIAQQLMNGMGLR